MQWRTRRLGCVRTYKIAYGLLNAFLVDFKVTLDQIRDEIPLTIDYGNSKPNKIDAGRKRGLRPSYAT